MKGLISIECPKSNLHRLPQLFAQMRRLNQRFLVLIDDLTFEQTADDFAAFKRSLEGSFIAQPTNCLIAVTTNRRFLLSQENPDQNSILDAEDERQDRLSLLERFGVSYHFLTPLQTEYLQVVRHHFKLRGIDITEADWTDIAEAAKSYAAQHGYFSYRMAKQFVDQHLIHTPAFGEDSSD